MRIYRYNDHAFVITLLFVVFGHSVVAQNKPAYVVNEGELMISSGTLIATHFDFDNKSTAVVFNNGEFQFYKNYNNAGLFTYSSKKTTGITAFKGIEVQNITGESPSSHYNVVFNNSSGAFALKNDMSIAGTASFMDGVVHMDSLKGGLVFQKGAKSSNASDKSYADGEVEKIGNEAFTYPIGDEGMYRFASISAPKTLKDSFVGKYYFKNSDRDQPHASRAGVIERIDDKEYWTVEREAKTKSDIILTLSWDARITPSALLQNVEELRVVRWDHRQNLWVDEGGIVDASAKTVTTPTTVDGYGIFTLGVVKQDLILEGDVVIYNAVTPNGDGHNDHFVIDNIERYPNNKVEIFNRWGVKVYSTSGYNNADNNFTGYSEGRVTVNKGEALPSGTYYYIVEYEYSNAAGSRMIKKAGYLHLETE